MKGSAASPEKNDSGKSREERFGKNNVVVSERPIFSLPEQVRQLLMIRLKTQSFQTNDGELVETLNQFPTFVLVDNSQQFIPALVN